MMIVMIMMMKIMLIIMTMIIMIIILMMIIMMMMIIMIMIFSYPHPKYLLFWFDDYFSSIDNISMIGAESPYIGGICPG